MTPPDHRLYKLHITLHDDYCEVSDGDSKTRQFVETGTGHQFVRDSPETWFPEAILMMWIEG